MTEKQLESKRKRFSRLNISKLNVNEFCEQLKSSCEIIFTIECSTISLKSATKFCSLSLRINFMSGAAQKLITGLENVLSDFRLFYGFRQLNKLHMKAKSVLDRMKHLLQHEYAAGSLS